VLGDLVVDQAVKGATLNKKKLAKISLPLPQRPEQARIAEVLDTLDEAIHGTALVIDKLERNRQGALRELLTCGLDQAGRVRWRGDRTLFKDTAIGPFPRDWSVAPLGTMLDSKRDPAMRSGPFGSALLKQDLVEEGHPLIGIDNVEVERFVPNFTRFITPAKFSDLSRYRTFANDVLITIMGTVGRCCLVPDGLEDALTTKHVWALSINPELYSPFLVCLQINHAPWALRHLNGDQQGGIMSAIRAETLRSVLLPVPPKEEREAIESVLRSMGEAIRIEQKRLQKLQALKSGLSTDLLTGHVRTQ
jgi:type I restriction enzyme S subunit